MLHKTTQNLRIEDKGEVIVKKWKHKLKIRGKDFLNYRTDPGNPISRRRVLQKENSKNVQEKISLK